MKLLRSNSNLFPSVFSDLFDIDRFFDFPFRNGESWLPAANIKEDEKCYKIDLAVPGMKKEDIKVEVENQLLTISGESKDEREEKAESYVRREYSSSSFSRSFSLPDSANEDTVSSSYEDGILKIRVEKKTPADKKSKKTIAIS